jgi:serine/threonine-protein kinase HipA
MRQIMDLLLGSIQAEQDRRDFLRTQVLYWMLCAIDGQAKNFSLFLVAAGRYRLTPRYDVVSAFPMLGNGRGKLAVKTAKMAVGVEGGGRHDLWHSIQRQYWDETARRCGMGKAMPALIDELIERTADVIATVGGVLPRDFPDDVAGPILEGLRRAAAELAGDKGKVEVD